MNASIANCPGGGGVVTTRLTVVEWFRLPLTPEIVNVDVPDGRRTQSVDGQRR